MARVYSMQTRAEAGAATRARLLDATAEVIAQLGGPGLTMQAVAQKADVALRTVYNYFSSKEDLVVEAYDRLASTTMAAARALPPSGSARQDLAAFIGAYLDSYQTQIGARVLVAGVPGLPELDNRIAQVRRWRRDQLKKLIKAAHREGELVLALPQAVAIAFLATAYPPWEILVLQLRMTPPAAKELILTTVDTSLFGASPPN